MAFRHRRGEEETRFYIGGLAENELTVIHVCAELVDAQKEYQSQQHDGDERQYAQTILSDQDKHKWTLLEGSLR